MKIYFKNDLANDLFSSKTQSVTCCMVFKRRKRVLNYNTNFVQQTCYFASPVENTSTKSIFMKNKTIYMDIHYKR